MNEMIFKNLTIGYFKRDNLRAALANSELIIWVISDLYTLLFLYAAANKLIDFQKFKVELGQSPILTDYALVIAFSIPAVEIMISICLVFGPRLLALYASFSLMWMFTLYIIVILNFAERIPCSCGGILEKMGWKEHLAFNIFFVLLGLIAIILQTKLNNRHARNSMN